MRAIGSLRLKATLSAQVDLLDLAGLATRLGIGTTAARTRFQQNLRHFRNVGMPNRNSLASSPSLLLITLISAILRASHTPGGDHLEPLY